MRLLDVKELTAGYGGITALHGVTIHVDEGEAVAGLGANGAGKSTMLKCIASVMKRISGSIEYCGSEISPRPYELVKNGLVLVPEGRQIFAKLSVMDNLRIGAELRSDAAGVKRDFERVFAMFPRLKERENQYGGLLSGGEQQMLAIARGLMAKPRLMMLDEPSLGLAPIIVSHIFENLKEIKEEGTALLLIEQNANKAISLCDRAYVFSTGKVVLEGTQEELHSNEVITEVYLH